MNLGRGISFRVVCEAPGHEGYILQLKSISGEVLLADYLTEQFCTWQIYSLSLLEVGQGDSPETRENGKNRIFTKRPRPRPRPPWRTNQYKSPPISIRVKLPNPTNLLLLAPPAWSKVTAV